MARKAKTSSKVKASPGLMVRIHAPSWYQDPRFLRYLDEGSKLNGSLATWHRTGRPTTEYSDLFVGVDGTLVEGELSCEGTDDDMPYWDEICAAVREVYPRGHKDWHIIVWISDDPGMDP